MIPAAWAREIDAWAGALAAARLSPQTIGLRTYHVRRLAQAGLAASPWEITRDDLLAWVGGHRWSRETARAVRSSIRRFWAWAVEVGRTRDNVADALPMIRQSEPRPHPTSQTSLAAGLAAARPDVRLMVRLACDLGMRRGEVARIHPAEDLTDTPDGWVLTVHGKGDKQRLLPVPADLAEEMIRRADGGYLFPSPMGGHLRAHTVGNLVSTALGGGGMHGLRHLFATEIHDQTRDVRLVQTLLGHSSLATTQRYLAVDDRALRAAVTARSARRTP